MLFNNSSRNLSETAQQLAANSKPVKLLTNNPIRQTSRRSSTMRFSFTLLLPSLCLLLCSSHAGADWLGFRGTHANGVAEDVAPTTCNEESVAWAVDVPGKGVSSPIVVGDQVVVTASSGVLQDRLHVISFDAGTGDRLWHRQFWATGRTLCHPTSANAAPTPASDGNVVVAFFSSNDVVCLGLDGELKWYRGLGHDYPKAGNDVGMASSPMLANGVVVCQVENQGDSFAEGISVADGTTMWRLDRPKSANWTSPVHLPSPTGDGVLLKSSNSVSAHDLFTGDTIWRIDAEVGGIPSMVVTDDRIYVPGATFLALDRNGDSAEVAWDSKRIKPGTSPSVDSERIVFINSAGVLNCHDSRTGDQLWQVRVGGKYWASPVCANGYTYTVNDGGVLSIVDRDGNKVGTHQFDGNVLGTPAISNGAIFVRGESKLWKVANR